jgi:hypothetical protein
VAVGSEACRTRGGGGMAEIAWFQPAPRKAVNRSVAQPRRVRKGAEAGKGCQKYS